jgi:spore coat protein CotF
MTIDNVNEPNHYKGEIECIDAIKNSMSIEEFKGFLKGNVQKYVWRYDKKNGIEDLKKAQWYLDRLIKENE